MAEKKKPDTEKDLATLRKLTVDLAKDGHFKQAKAAADVHELIEKLSKLPTEES
jgi:hypothetical protein